MNTDLTSSKKIFVSSGHLFNQNSTSQFNPSQTSTNQIFLPAKTLQSKIITPQFENFIRSDQASSIEQFPSRSITSPSKCDSGLKHVKNIMENHRSMQSRESLKSVNFIDEFQAPNEIILKEQMNNGQRNPNFESLEFASIQKETPMKHLASIDTQNSKRSGSRSNTKKNQKETTFYKSSMITLSKFQVSTGGSQT